jgi:hypothetical protein
MSSDKDEKTYTLIDKNGYCNIPRGEIPEEKSMEKVKDYEEALTRLLREQRRNITNNINAIIADNKI